MQDKDTERVVVTIHKTFRRFSALNIPQNHQSVNRFFVILFKKGVIIYNLALFSFVGKDKNAKAADKKGLGCLHKKLCNTPKALFVTLF